MFTRAIVRKPCPRLAEDYQEENASGNYPDYHTALIQHDLFVSTLRRLGLKVIILEADNRSPHSVFVEDGAVCLPEIDCLIFARNSSPQRRKEIFELKHILQPHFSEIHYIHEPGIMKASDVLWVHDHVYIGISKYTNHQGADQLIDILQNFQLRAFKIPLEEQQLLRAGLTHLGNNTLLISESLYSHPRLEPFNKIKVPDSENHAAGCLNINGTIVLPSRTPDTQSKLQDHGYETIEIELTEFQKMEGQLSQLSILY